jgi:hypothetical protein
MGEFPFAYERIAATTWAYMSSLLMLALFFKFNRFWSVRNFDLLLIIMLAPGLLMIEGGSIWLKSYEANRRPAAAQQENVQPALADDATKKKPENQEADSLTGESPTNPLAAGSQSLEANDSVVSTSAATGKSDRIPVNDAGELDLDPQVESPVASQLSLPGYTIQRMGYYWLLFVAAVFLVRMLLDPRLVRKPILDPNLSIGGLVFFGLSLMVFLFANIVTSEPTIEDVRGARDAVKLLQREAAQDVDTAQLKRRGPGYRLFNLLPIIPSFNNGGEIMKTDADEVGQMSRYVIAAKSLAIASQVLIVLGLVLFCYYHYGNFNVGVGIATIYLILPYTAIYTGHVLHTLPAALMIWALVSFRKPLWSGVLIGLATGVSYYAIFLLPLWVSFYWLRGVRRFLIGVLVSLSVCILGLAFTSTNTMDFVHQVQAMFGFWSPLTQGLEGIWALGWNQWYRMPLLVAFITLAVSFVAWPAEKNLGTLVSYSGAIMLAVQFWHGFGGGLYMAWYLPMVLLAFFRPNLNGRIALTELVESNWRTGTEDDDQLISAA